MIGELTAVINKYGLNNQTNTADMILAEYLVAYVDTLAVMLNTRDSWNTIPKQTEQLNKC